MNKFAIPKSSFLYRFIIRFIFMIILPIFCFWWIYVAVLNFFYTENTLANQQINMEKSFSVLNSSLNAASNVITVLGRNREIAYYLDYYSDKREMLYSLIKNIQPFCDNLYKVTAYLTGLKIYSDSPILLYAEPFTRLEDIPLDEDTMHTLENSDAQEIIWQVDYSDTEEFPVIYGYQKLYTANYSKCIGYVEVQLSSTLFFDYFELLSNLSDDPKAVLTLYQERTPIYSTGSAGSALVPPENLEPGYKVDLFKNQYQNCLEIPKLNLYVVRSGRLSDRQSMQFGNVPSILGSIVILLLLVLFIVFFISVASLSKRILKFSSFIKHSDPEHLSPFYQEKKSFGRTGDDEIDSLIDAYNMMIQEKSSLISQIRKMELLSQDARFQALQGQIHPHFIYGTLETIRMIALQNKDKEAAAMIFSLSSLIRYSISISSESVTLQDELEVAHHYLKIQKIRFDERMDYEFHVEEKLRKLQIPSFILQPILENAIAYGISKTLEPCNLTVDIYEEETCIVIKVSNSGLLITQRRLLEINELLSGRISLDNFRGNHNGLALNNIRERLTIFFNGQASIRMERQNDCTATVITIQKE